MKLKDCIMILEGVGFLALVVSAFIADQKVQFYWIFGSVVEILLVAFVGMILQNIQSIHKNSTIKTKLKIWSIISLPLGFLAIIVAVAFSAITHGKANAIAFILFMLGVFVISSFFGMSLQNGDKK